MKQTKAGSTVDKNAEKMEQVLRYVKNMEVNSSQKIRSLPKRGSLRVISQIKIKELIG
ncbi:MAG: hypothetical protein NPINA01_22930 [Nitrospinaceae bacterium]|nr:MAG: hypothetical protein NPINA01_22930 [Nitrospinaceae bacterium]